MNDDLTDEQRARALELYRKYVQVRNGSPSSVDGRERLSNLSVRAWLAVEAHVLASHTCRHVWRPTTRDEIQAGWEVLRGQHHAPAFGCSDASAMDRSKGNPAPDADAVMALIEPHLRIAEAAREWVASRQAASQPGGDFAAAARALDTLLAAVDAEQAGGE